MRTFKAVITPRSAFGTPLLGDTLFGQLCWVLRNRLGEAQLVELLQGYTTGQPFLVVSDAFPAGYLPRPALPSHLFVTPKDAERKALKKRAWLPLTQFHEPVTAWLQRCQPASEIPGGEVHAHPQPHNRINRLTNTTGADHAPYSLNQLWHGQRYAAPPTTPVPEVIWDTYWVLDETRLDAATLQQALQDLGAWGFGRDASIGLGKFAVREFVPFELPMQAHANAWLTLAPCAPQGLAWQAERCFYQPFTRFGRHGDLGVHLGNPFKTPVLLASTAAS